MSKTFLGLDISKAKFDVALLMDDRIKTKKFDNNSSGFLELVNWLHKKEIEIKTLHSCMEATGRYGDALANFLFESGYQISVVNPARIKGFAQSQLSRNKTDKSDAQLIAKFCQAMQPVLWKPDPAHIQELQALVHRLQALQQMRQQENNRLESIASPYIKASIDKIIEKLSEEIDEIKMEIANSIDKNIELRSKKELLNTIPGIGESTIAQILAFL